MYVCDPDCELSKVEETIVWELDDPLPTDGSADGTYTIKVRVEDKTGGVAQYNSTFLYDSRVVAILSTTPVDEAVVTALNQIVIQASDGTGSGINFAETMATMTLTDVSADAIIREHNGVDTMTFSFPALENPGMYSVGITIWDNAGTDDADVTDGANGYAY